MCFLSWSASLAVFRCSSCDHRIGLCGLGDCPLLTSGERWAGTAEAERSPVTVLGVLGGLVGVERVEQLRMPDASRS